MKSYLLLAALACGAGSYAQSASDTLLLHFDYNRADLTVASQEALRQWKEVHAGTAIVLRGHCDFRGSHAYNDALSQRRVAAVRDYLISSGFSADNIGSIEALGERAPLNTNSTEAEMAVNRRVELIWQPPVVSVVPPDTISNTVTQLRNQIDSLKEGESIRLPHVNFYGGRHVFLPESLASLDALLKIMQEHPTMQVEIQGHICCFRGEIDGFDHDSNDYNLSVNRARAVQTFLIRNGIDPLRLSAKGFGGTQPLVSPERTEDDRTANRRVEIKILKK